MVDFLTDLTDPGRNPVWKIVNMAVRADCSFYTKNSPTQHARPRVQRTDLRLALSTRYAQIKPMRSATKAAASALTVC